MKGLSPLIATVILIGLTMVVAGILGVWASSFVGQRLQTFENASAKCELVSFEVFRCIKSNNSLRIILNSRSTVDLNGIRFILIYLDGNTIQRDDLTQLQANSLQTYNITDVPTENLESIIIRSLECPNRELTITC